MTEQQNGVLNAPSCYQALLVDWTSQDENLSMPTLRTLLLTWASLVASKVYKYPLYFLEGSHTPLCSVLSEALLFLIAD